ncbi:MAG: hypothetical protein PWP65_627 [Clostridia bacterium]|nr:hypothetical protein [Clostridia bacterium]
MAWGSYDTIDIAIFIFVRSALNIDCSRDMALIIFFPIPDIQDQKVGLLLAANKMLARESGSIIESLGMTKPNSNPFNNDRYTLATAYAQGGQAVFNGSFLHLMQEGNQDTGTAGAYGMAQSYSSAINVYFLGIKA